MRKPCDSFVLPRSTPALASAVQHYYRLLSHVQTIQAHSARLGRLPLPSYLPGPDAGDQAFAAAIALGWLLRLLARKGDGHAHTLHERVHNLELDTRAPLWRPVFALVSIG